MTSHYTISCEFIYYCKAQWVVRYKGKFVLACDEREEAERFVAMCAPVAEGARV